MQERWITAREAAAYTATSLPTIYRAARSGRLRGIKVNKARLWRFRADLLDKWLEGETSEMTTAKAGSVR